MMKRTPSRWVSRFSQLETLRHCLQHSVRRTLDGSPESLEETYEHAGVLTGKEGQEAKPRSRPSAVATPRCGCSVGRSFEVKTDGSRVVQFSHLSPVKEFLTSTRLADSKKNVLSVSHRSRACDLGTSLHGRFALARRRGVVAEYAARH